MQIVLLSLALMAILCGKASAQENYCYSSDTVRLQRTHFASKTAYQLIKGTAYKDQAAVPNCTPTKFWLLSRHGTRLPKAKQISDLVQLEPLRDAILKNYADNSSIPSTGSLCAGDLQLLKDWVLNKNITVNHSEYLTDQGWNDLKMLGQDYQKVYPDLLTSKYNETEFLFRHSDTQRTQASCEAFIDGLFGTNAYQKINTSKIDGNDTLLTPFKFCPLWNQQHDKIEDVGSQAYKFENSELMNQTIVKISLRLGFDTPLKFEQVRLIWDMCRFETAWFLDKPSAWCTALTLENVEVLEYLEDLTDEYENGYGSPIDQNIPCLVVQDMLKRLNSDDEPRVSAYFSHSELIQLVTVALQILKDKTLLTSSNYDTMTDRKWRTSLFDSFAANIAAIKYDCSANKEDPSPKVQFFMNQSPIEFSFCKNGLCKLSDIITKYTYFLDADCPLLYCRENSSSFIRGSIILIVISIVYNFFF